MSQQDQPVGQADTVAVGAVRISSNDPWFFFRGLDWQSGGNAPPPRMAFDVSGIEVPLDAAMLRQPTALLPPPDAADPCARGSAQTLRCCDRSV